MSQSTTFVNNTNTSNNQFVTVYLPIQITSTVANQFNLTNNQVVPTSAVSSLIDITLNQYFEEVEKDESCFTESDVATTAHTTNNSTTSTTFVEHSESNSMELERSSSSNYFVNVVQEQVEVSDNACETTNTNRSTTTTTEKTRVHTTTTTSTSCVFANSQSVVNVDNCLPSVVVSGAAANNAAARACACFEGNNSNNCVMHHSSRSSSHTSSDQGDDFDGGNIISSFIIGRNPCQAPNVPCVNAPAVAGSESVVDGVLPSWPVLPLQLCVTFLAIYVVITTTPTLTNTNNNSNNKKSRSVLRENLNKTVNGIIINPTTTNSTTSTTQSSWSKRSLVRQRSNSTGNIKDTCRVREIQPWTDSTLRRSTNNQKLLTGFVSDNSNCINNNDNNCTTQNNLTNNTECHEKIVDDSVFYDWFSDFNLMEESTEKADAIVTKRQPRMTYRTLEQFLASLESVDETGLTTSANTVCDHLPCNKTHTFNRPSAPPRLVIKSTWCVYGNSLNEELFYNCLFDDHCGDIIVDHFEPIVQDPDLFHLSSGGRRILDTPNAGGNSVWSEVLSYEVLHNVFGAQLKKTETEIEYAPGSKITDYSVDFNGHHIGVSVVRIINFFDLMGKKYKAVFTPEYAKQLLYKKLFGVLASTEAVVDKWEKQILYIWTTSSHAADIIVEEYWKIPKKLRSNTLVYVTHATNSEFVF